MQRRNMLLSAMTAGALATVTGGATAAPAQQAPRRSTVIRTDDGVQLFHCDWGDGRPVLFVHSFDEKPREIAFASGLPGEDGKLLVNLLAQDHSPANEDGVHNLLLEAYGYRWFRVGGLDYLLKRSDIDTDSTGKASYPT